MIIVIWSYGIWNRYFNPTYWCGVKMTSDINPTCIGMETSCPWEYVLFGDVRLA